MGSEKNTKPSRLRLKVPLDTTMEMARKSIGTFGADSPEIWPDVQVLMVGHHWTKTHGGRSTDPCFLRFFVRWGERIFTNSERFCYVDYLDDVGNPDAKIQNWREERLEWYRGLEDSSGRIQKFIEMWEPVPFHELTLEEFESQSLGFGVHDKVQKILNVQSLDAQYTEPVRAEFWRHLYDVTDDRIFIQFGYDRDLSSQQLQQLSNLFGVDDMKVRVVDAASHRLCDSKLAQITIKK